MFTACAVSGGPAHADDDAAATAPVRSLLSQAVDLYQSSEFERAKKMLVQLRARVGERRDRQAQQVFTYLAFVHVAFGEAAAAVTSFERALAIRPDMKLAAPSPKIAAAFDQARKRHVAKIRALDHDPPALRHTPPKAGAYGARIEIAVQARDLSPVRRVTLNYRIAGDRGFTAVEMERRKGKAAYVASIPMTAVVRPGLEYYVAAWDELGNGPGLKGSTGAPIRVPVTGGPAAGDRLGGDKPWYKKWWVWAAIGTAAAAVGAATVGIIAGRTETATFGFTIPDGLDPGAPKP